MRVYDIILKKRNGGELSAEEIEFIVSEYVRGEVPDSQMAAWLMAIYFRGMTHEETAHLTMSMVHSGRTLDLSSIPGIKVDKHSTGGVGDKATLVVIPLLAAAGVPVIKMSGRSLGHTGGTLDKLESIPGFTVALFPEQMMNQVKRIGAAIAGQTSELVPADKKIYSLRDITATVDCIPLIAASVMSKKIASGADAIVLDVKTGSGAFMKTIPEAVELAQTMVEIGRQVGRKTIAAITDMEQPLGRAVGNALEIREAIETLKGHGSEDVVELCAVLGGIGLMLGQKASTREEGAATVRALIAGGQGVSKLREVIKAQGGNPAVVDDPSMLPAASIIQTVKSPSAGYASRLDALQIAQAATTLGAGRGEAGASPNLSVGVRLLKKMHDKVSTGEPLAEVHADNQASADEASILVTGAYSFSSEQPEPRPLVHQIIE